MKTYLSLIVLLAVAGIAISQTKFATSVQVPTIAITNGPPVIGQVWSATSTAGGGAWSNAPAGTPGGNTAAIQFNQSGSFAGTNRLVYDRTNSTLEIFDLGDGTSLRVRGQGIIESGDGKNLTLGVQNALGALSNWWVNGAYSTINFGSFEPALSNKYSIGSTVSSVSNIWVNDLHSKISIDVGVGSATNGSVTLYDMSGTKWSRLEAPGTVVNTNTYRLWESTNVGIVTARNVTDGIGQLTNITLTAGQYVTYNGTAYVASNAPTVFEMPVSGLASNVSQIIYKMHSGSVLGANSNQTIWLGQTNVSDLLVSTNVTFTNFNGITAGNSASFTAFMKVTNAAANVGVNWGNLGGSNPGYAIAIWTNANSPMWKTLTNTKTYVLSVTSRGTNLHPTLTLWE